jgi:CubicO group peptidase (beta-lactamase class C family)
MDGSSFSGLLTRIEIGHMRSGSAGEFMWAGYAGTYFWVDPKEELIAVYMSQAPSPIRAYYRKLVKQLAYGALTD